MRIPFVAGNWKMNTTLDEAVSLVRSMHQRLDVIEGTEKAVCPPFVSIAAISEMLRGSTIGVGAQNMYFEEKGAYTGEISPMMLNKLCKYVIVGHSERRQYFGETNQMVNKKLKAAFKAGLTPIMCVGERLEENEAGKTEEVITDQLFCGLDGITANSGNMVIAYEPVWAIGTGKAATSTQAQTTISLIRKKLSTVLGKATASDMRILYGGSVTAANAGELAAQPDIDGALVGGASLKPQEFVAIVEATAAAKHAQ
ncbi:MAG: triose-phosphate isomerase [Chloroflexi bacterium]|nr:triose-phosphate isomerase [Chloroflexota bacterium]